MRHQRKRISLLFLFALVCIAFILASSHQKRHLRSSLNLTLYDEMNCGCPRPGPVLTFPDNASLCSDWSTARGNGQKVVAYAIYGNHSNREVFRHYYSQLENRIKEVKFYYEGWIVRLYHNTSKEDKFATKILCDLYCRYPSLDLCQVNNLFIPDSWANESLSSQIKNDIGERVLNKDEESSDLIDTVQTKIIDFLTSLMNPWDYGLVNEEFAESFEGERTFQDEGGRAQKSFGNALTAKLWRFLPLGDDTVDEFIVRDADSFILPREVSAVRQWLHNSTALVHAMRDHPSHNGVILAGMWGATRWRDTKKMTKFLKKILTYPPKNLWNYDQILLRRVLWPDVSHNILVHDSYHCQNPFLKAKTHALPYPTKRRGNLFVGWGPTRSTSELKAIVPCPLQCRPRSHPEWELC